MLKKMFKMYYIQLCSLRTFWNRYGIDSNILLDKKEDAIKFVHYVKIIVHTYVFTFYKTLKKVKSEKKNYLNLMMNLLFGNANVENLSI